MDKALINSIITLHYSVSLTAQCAHWNMAGPDFAIYHELTGQLYDEFSKKLDNVVEECLSHANFSEVEINLPCTHVFVLGTPLECLESVLQEIEEYSNFLHNVIEESEDLELSIISEDTIINLIHFVDLWVWRISRNM